jgi:hypothetical protein
MKKSISVVDLNKKLKEADDFFRWRQKQVAKIVQCGEALEEDRTSLVSTEH